MNIPEPFGLGILVFVAMLTWSVFGGAWFMADIIDVKHFHKKIMLCIICGPFAWILGPMMLLYIPLRRWIMKQ